MTNNDMLNKFADMDRDFAVEEKSLGKRYSAISTVRVISFLAGAALLIVGVADGIFAAGIAGGIFLLIFVYLIKLHGDVVKKTEIVKSQRMAAGKYLKRFKEKWRTFSDDGSEFLSEEDRVAADIDLLGPNSLYQMINVCHTDYGRRMLAEDMKLENVKLDKISERQEAIRELMKDEDFAVRYEGAGIRLGGSRKKFNTKRFEGYCKDESSGMLPVWARAVRIVLPVVEMIFIILWALRVFNYGLPLAGFIAVLGFSWLTKSVTNAVIEPFYSVSFVIDEYLDMLELIAAKEFKSGVLNEISVFAGKEEGAVKAFRELKKISQAYNISYNPLIHQLLSGIILWDYQLACAVSKWKKKYGVRAAGCFNLIGEMEELLSFAVLGMVRETGWAEITTEDTEEVSLKCRDLYHPLIAPDKVQPNSAVLTGGITIITGSNMSGKTTFLRTLAMNLALAYMGAPMCGSELSASYMKIFTSMRVMDDVAHGISTFYAEILRIKSMAEYRRKNKPMLCLIDEIFKGTNSADRIVGAREAITRLSGKRSMTIVSTHDFELCSIEDKSGSSAVNYHFEEYYKDDELRFDYKIKEGRCTTTNARAILRMAGFDVAD